jgi:hypothetical protein
MGPPRVVIFQFVRVVIFQFKGPEIISQCVSFINFVTMLKVTLHIFYSEVAKYILYIHTVNA